MYLLDGCKACSLLTVVDEAYTEAVSIVVAEVDVVDCIVWAVDKILVLLFIFANVSSSARRLNG